VRAKEEKMNATNHERNHAPVPRLHDEEAEKALRRLQEHEKVMHERIGWKGRPCLSDLFLAATLRGAKAYLQELEKAEGIIDRDEERDKYLMMIMLLFASVRPDLDANLFADERKPSKDESERELSPAEKENLRLQWRDLGFPIEIREKLRKELRD
jgi:hypothetical protein